MNKQDSEDFKQVTKEFREAIDELLDQFLIFEDIKGLQELVHVVKVFSNKRLKNKRQTVGVEKEKEKKK